VIRSAFRFELPRKDAGHVGLAVVVDKLSKQAHLLPLKLLTPGDHMSAMDNLSRIKKDNVSSLNQGIEEQRCIKHLGCYSDIQSKRTIERKANQTFQLKTERTLKRFIVTKVYPQRSSPTEEQDL
jgi:hypothetical protein